MQAPLPSTLAERIVARAAGRDRVRPGEIVTARVDLAMIHDSGGPRRVKPMLEELGTGVWDPDRVVVVSDHYVPAVDAQSAAILKLTRDWVKAQSIRHFYDQMGICHVVLPERGHLRPGQFVVGGDSHSPTGGAWGAFMFGIGATDMAGVLATGETWLRVPETILLHWSGALADGVCAKDMMLHLCATLGMDGGRYQVVQYAGPTIAGLSMTERMTLSNMAAELGAQTGLIAPDAVTAEAIRAAGGDPGAWQDWQDDPDAPVAERHDFDAAALVPQVAAPHSPANAGPVMDAEPTAIDQCYIGACTGAKLEDLHAAARVLKGRRVAAGTRLLLAPASTRITAAAAADGTLAALTEAGAILLPSGCGACAGYGAGVLAEDETCMASTARNFRGRMGAASAKVWLGSPYTVAATAVAGCIADPRPLLAEAPR
ncbi:3-isopropylmalate dehydratase large subunit [Marinibaculum pumilum]|uniref:3-isopropylmalate dehydratase large subunit n=1 Tax=Marinibaculum pumilum TaxID=1766165 RepID=A0ABV7KYS8_9PROT